MAIEVKFTRPAEDAVGELLAEDFDGQDPKEWHVDKVLQFAAMNAELLPGVTKARIRAPAHVGGTTDPREKEHITVTYKAKNTDISSPYGKGGAWHVYTGR